MTIVLIVVVENQESDFTLARAVQKLIGSSKPDYFEDTIVESDINQIRHTFYFLRSEKIPVFVSYQLDEYIAGVEDVTENSVTLSIPNFEDGPVRRCRLKFDVHGVLYEFEVALLEATRSEIVVRLPSLIQSVELRKYRRIGVDDLFMRFTIDSSDVFQSAEDLQTANSRFPELLFELDKIEPNLYLINQIVAEELEKISPDFELKFYKEGEVRNLPESLMIKEKKTIYINNTSKLENYYTSHRSQYLMSYLIEFKRIARERTEDDAEKYFAELQKQDLRNFLNNYVYSPVMVFERNVGHLYVQSTLLDKRLLLADQAYYVYLLATILSHAMSKTVIARSYNKFALTRVLDVSLGGMLFELNNTEIFNFIMLNDRIQISLHLKHEILHFVAEVSRLLPPRKEGGGYRIGVNFIDASNDHFKLLEAYLFEKRKQALTVQPLGV